MAIDGVGLAGDAVEVIHEAFLARRRDDALGIRLVAVDRAELGGEVLLPADPSRGTQGLRKYGR